MSGWVSSEGSAGDTLESLPQPSDRGPSSARMYDYFLGGKDNMRADREAGDKVKAATPWVVKAARANRRFLHVAVEHLVSALGVGQILDIGTGIPTPPNTHQVAQWHKPEARVLYTDYDPIVLAHARALMTSTPEGRVDYIMADLRKPQTILSHSCLAGPQPVLDLRQPVAVLMLAVLHFVPDKYEPAEILRTVMEPMAPGSYLLMSHVTPDLDDEDETREVVRTYWASGLEAQVRSREEIAALVDAAGLELVEPPGIQPITRWWPTRPGELAPHPLYTDVEAMAYGLLAYKP